MEDPIIEGKKYQCSYCTKVLSSKQNLKEHLFTHSGEKPYVCKEKGCGIKFRQGSQLSAHRRIHKSIQGKAQKAYFYDIKLSDILIRHPHLLDEEYNENLPQTANTLINVPLITVPQENIVLPSIL
ncbi:unnamed protein product [Blepharisma stoltei]|uniref:C2H2-type domain-containing protein n=1 Tax=Blepharisma stoltei TaxID=1481888 RepID=A0AAU9JJP3_9CILI|nr:unnamed protein product [Blepharisma stoltei]